VSPRARSRWLGRRYLSLFGRWQVSSYAIMLSMGCVAGVFVGADVARAAGLPEPRFVLATALLLVPALVGARLWCVLQHAAHYRAYPERSLGVGEGGMGLYGGLVLAVAVSVPMLPALGIPFWVFWDAAGVTILVGLIITRFGCLMNGCCAGRPTHGRWALVLPNHAGEWRRRYPTPLLEAVFCVVVLAAALFASTHQLFPGALFGAVVGAYSICRLATEPTRESALAQRTLSVDFLFSGALLMAAVLVLVLKQPD
jgi:phosphatidylglycerol:prolipoprotein diacylglycerol transferase